MDQPAQRLLGLTGGAVLAVVQDALGLEPQPTPQAGDEPVALREPVELIHDDAIHQPEDAGVGGAGQVGHRAEDRIERLEPHAAHAAVGAAVALAEDDLVPRLPLRNHLRNHLRRVLQIPVDEDDAIAAGVVNAGRHRGLVSEVARQVDELEPRVFRVVPPNHLPRRVAAAVVHEHDLPVFARLSERFRKPPAQLREVLLLVKDRDDDGNHCRR